MYHILERYKFILPILMRALFGFRSVESMSDGKLKSCVESGERGEAMFVSAVPASESKISPSRSSTVILPSNDIIIIYYKESGHAFLSEVTSVIDPSGCMVVTRYREILTCYTDTQI